MESSELSTLPGDSPDHKRPAPTLSSPSSSSPKRLKVEAPAGHVLESRPIPDAALLYHHAYSAWQAAQNHLTQAFIPSNITPASSGIDPIWLLDPSNPNRSIKYNPDPEASNKALSLQILALDFLKIGLGMSDLPDKERVAFGILFGKVGLQVLSGQKTLQDRKGKGKAGSALEVDAERLIQDVEEQINRSVRLCP
jgi:hypothetical protein